MNILNSAKSHLPIQSAGRDRGVTTAIGTGIGRTVFTRWANPSHGGFFL